jgi:CheY-like chemotaxis protein
MAGGGESPNPTRATVLLVEDDDDTRSSISEFLEEEGYRTVATANGEDAQAYLRRSPPPACIVLDLMMPVMDGWTLASLMRDGHLPQVPIVVITAAEAHWGYPAEPGQVLRKPVNAERLLRLVRALSEGGEPAR